MLTLTIRTDKPEAEVGLYDDATCLSYDSWLAHRQLAETLNRKIIDVLRANGKYLHDLQAIAVYKGPGSFTGLRIGLSVANALAYALQIPIVATKSDAWLSIGFQRLAADANEQVAMPEYGAAPNITKPRK